MMIHQTTFIVQFQGADTKFPDISWQELHRWTGAEAAVMTTVNRSIALKEGWA